MPVVGHHGNLGKTMPAHHVDVVVVGGGIAGLATAYQLSRIGTGLSVVLLEGDHMLGGKIQSSRIAGGHASDVGPDAFLSSAPVVQRLCDELYLSESLVTPVNGATGILVDNTVR